MLLRSPHGLHVRKVLRTTTGQFRDDQILRRNYINAEGARGIEGYLYSVRPARRKLHARNFWKNIHLAGRGANTKKCPGFQELIFLHFVERRSKLNERFVNRCDVPRIGTHKDVHVLCGTRLRMDANRPTPDHQIPHVARVEGRQEIAEIAV